MKNVTYVRLPELRGWYWKRTSKTGLRFLHNKEDEFIDVDFGYAMSDEDVNNFGIWMSDFYNLAYAKGRVDEFDKQQKLTIVSR